MSNIKNVIIVHIGNLFDCPPALNVANLLIQTGYEVTIVTTKDKGEDEYRKVLGEKPNISLLSISDPHGDPLISKAAHMLRCRKELWEIIGNYYIEGSSVIWVSSVISIKYLGMNIVNKNYIFHVMELSESIRYSLRHKHPTMDAEKLGNSALAVVVPEKMRAYITQAWWNLDLLPMTLPNKPVEAGSSQRGQLVTDSNAAKILSTLEGRKIILYQGIVHKERPLKPYLDAVEQLGGDYIFVTMGSDDPLPGVKDDYYSHIPYISPPYHLEVTSNAYIGVLSYFPYKGHISVLNPVFCAPNKTFEYAKYGVPMLANENPVLDRMFEKYGCGYSIANFESSEIAEAVLWIENNYQAVSDGSREYYSSVDMPATMRKIMDTVEKRLAKHNESESQ